MLYKKGFRFTFLGFGNYGISCYFSFLLSALAGFLRVKRKYTAHTYTNHNIRPSGYQLIIGGNNDKTIGVYLVDSALLNKDEIAHDLFRPAYFVTDYLVLNLV